MRITVAVCRVWRVEIDEQMSWWFVLVIDIELLEAVGIDFSFGSGDAASSGAYWELSSSTCSECHATLTS
jgi:hypothetical protein